MTVQRILPIKAPMLLGCKPCICLVMAKDFHSWCVLVNVFPCLGLTDCSLSCSVRWELGSVSDGLGESAVSSVDHKARKSKETWILLFSVVVGCSSSYLQDFLCCLSQQWFKKPYAFSGKRTSRVWLWHSCSVFPVQQEVEYFDTTSVCFVYTFSTSIHSCYNSSGMMCKVFSMQPAAQWPWKAMDSELSTLPDPLFTWATCHIHHIPLGSEPCHRNIL